MKGYFQVSETPVIVGWLCPRSWPSSCSLHLPLLICLVLLCSERLRSQFAYSTSLSPFLICSRCGTEARRCASGVH